MVEVTNLFINGLGFLLPFISLIHSGSYINKGLNMQCPCGAEVQDRTHVIKTLRGAKEWLPTFNDNEIEFHLPVLIEQKECPKCGRHGFKVWGKRTGSTRFDLLLHSRI